MTAPVGLATGALNEVLRTPVGVHAHWYSVLEMVVVTVTAAEGDEMATDDGAAAEEEAGVTEVEILLTIRPPMMLALVLAPLTAFFK